jgi:hypothetical protein
MNKLHISIIDKENNETLVDTDTCVIVGAFDKGASTCGIAYMDCNSIDLANACVAAQQTIDRIKNEHPEVKALMTALVAMEAAQE